jgi:hypothetical protein
MSAEEVAKAFVQHYYQTFDGNVDQLAGLYVSLRRCLFLLFPHWLVVPAVHASTESVRRHNIGSVQSCAKPDGRNPAPLAVLLWCLYSGMPCWNVSLTCALCGSRADDSHLSILEPEFHVDFRGSTSARSTKHSRKVEERRPSESPGQVDGCSAL